ncbi:unknown protein [Spodoptera frugiperda multiple nucleopolyhedrovirus]|uniref:Uncharacterized protein n=1 Tax=Spodoptera frugiperda nuclear polyhedrosis virus TaxID=10455 RepID=A1YJC3_NPVSF|nr:hypothetical protein SFMNPV_gp133 [Spodoptera frugiperda multiple nucleopolyhedrovirus]ABM45843.1 unknown protein [Spodoptera frugiperda multiple nucleopolyhedrovirus]ACA02689.1 unknown [Spodoptera frugiperda multiple nucleopolyhedrovirus]ADV91365.1 hypothetical protein Sf133 [Spodoptera frugiperda multiple nucleopolyhedrovirus]AFH59076.1 hypothetical protein Sf133 [Spodoptera frugiperda multiple nucleopolyhedrovirus]AIW01544.1 hypothetical protein [Spodoptera frugiperda multiple nucleopoly
MKSIYSTFWYESTLSTILFTITKMASPSLEIKLALYHYFAEWCTNTRIKEMINGQAFYMAEEFKYLSMDNHENTFVFLNELAAMKDEWELSKEVATIYVNTNKIHPQCCLALKHKLNSIKDKIHLENNVNEYLQNCYTDIFNSYYKMYNLVNLTLTGDTVYGNCYFTFVVGYYCLNVDYTHKKSTPIKNLIRNYLERDINKMELFYSLKNFDRGSFVVFEEQAWSRLIQFIKTPHQMFSNFLRSFFKRMNFDFIGNVQEYEMSSTRIRRNQLMCIALFGHDTELRIETDKYLSLFI